MERWQPVSLPHELSKRSQTSRLAFFLQTVVTFVGKTVWDKEPYAATIDAIIKEYVASVKLSDVLASSGTGGTKNLLNTMMVRRWGVGIDPLRSVGEDCELSTLRLLKSLLDKSKSVDKVVSAVKNHFDLGVLMSVSC